jgi:putative glycosyltransferase
MLPMQMRLSVVTTLYRSAEHLAEFHRRMSREAEKMALDYEIVYVNDGSPDASLDVALALAATHPNVSVVDLARNFGHHKAMMTGLAYARGERVFLLDCDLEEEPELLSSFAAAMQESKADVVYGVQSRRKGGPTERWSGRLFFWIFNQMAEHPLPRNLCTVRLMTRRYVKALVAHQERAMVIGGLWVITGFAQVALPITKGRRDGSSYTIARRVDVLVNAVTSFSDKPLKLIFYMGMGIFALALAAATYVVVRRVLFGVLLAGWASLMISVWLLGGLTLFSIGILGIYLQKVFIETKQRPYTIVREVHGALRESP